MKKTNFLIVALLSLAWFVLISGCITKNPQAGVVNPDGSVQDPFIVNTNQINKVNDTARAGTDVVRPFIGPYSGLIDLAREAGVVLVGGISGWLATRRNAKKQLEAFGASVVRSGSSVTKTVLDNASNGEHFEAIAGAINVNAAAGTGVAGEAMKAPHS